MGEIRAVYDRNLMINGCIRPIYNHHIVPPGKATREKLLKLGWITIPHPPYPPDLASTDYHLYCSLSVKKKSTMRTTSKWTRLSFLDRSRGTSMKAGFLPCQSVGDKS